MVKGPNYEGKYVFVDVTNIQTDSLGIRGLVIQNIIYSIL